MSLQRVLFAVLQCACAFASSSRIKNHAPPALSFVMDAPFGDNMVLQAAPATAALYGYIEPNATGVRVTVSSGGAPVYSVDAVMNATTQPFGTGWGARPCPKAVCPPYDMDTFTPFPGPLPSWKALLRPTPPGGDYTISAVCTGCGSSTQTLTIVNITFGDVWFCSGEHIVFLFCMGVYPVDSADGFCLITALLHRYVPC